MLTGVELVEVLSSKEMLLLQGKKSQAKPCALTPGLWLHLSVKTVESCRLCSMRTTPAETENAYVAEDDDDAPIQDKVLINYFFISMVLFLF